MSLFFYQCTECGKRTDLPHAMDAQIPLCCSEPVKGFIKLPAFKRRRSSYGVFVTLDKGGEA